MLLGFFLLHALRFLILCVSTTVYACGTVRGASRTFYISVTNIGPIV